MPSTSSKKTIAKKTKANAVASKVVTESEESTPGPAPVAKKAHRYRPGTRALLNVLKQQKRTKTDIPRACASRFFRAIASRFKDDLKFSAGSIDHLQWVLEHFIVSKCKAAHLVCLFAGRKTLMPRDIRLAIRLDESLPKAVFTKMYKKRLDEPAMSSFQNGDLKAQRESDMKEDKIIDAPIFTGDIDW